MSGFDYYIQAIVAVLVLVDPITRGIFFRLLTQDEPERRRGYVVKIMATVGITLGGSALVGRELLDLLGISLGAFSVAGGLVLATMGFEMLLGGEPSRAQGGAAAHEEPAPAGVEDSIVVPYAIPFMAGPGAIATVISIVASGRGLTGLWAALVAVAVVVALIPVGHLWLANRLNISARAMSIATKFGGLLVASIGVQLILSGVREYFTS